jgi:hypothetical protein
VVSEEQWLAARAEIAQRRRKPGRSDKHVNPFAGLLKNALEHNDSYHCVCRDAAHGRGTPDRILITQAAREGRGNSRTFPYHLFEQAILSELREIDPKEILHRDRGPAETDTLAGQLALVEDELAQATAFMEAKGFSVTIGQRVQKLEAQQRELTEQLAAAREKAAHPLRESWDQAQTLMAALASAPDPDDARLRLRSALRRIVEGIWVLVQAVGRYRLAKVQIWFTGGQRYRSYFLIHCPAIYNGKGTPRPPRYNCRAITHPDDNLPFEKDDLRDPGIAKCVLGVLENYDRGMIEEALEGTPPIRRKKKRR